VASVLPASILQHHPDAKILLDNAAASELKRADYYRWVYENKPDWQRDA
jgi:glucosamine-6-phosphate deaminase